MKYKKKFEIDIHDVDFNGVARASALMKYMQSAAQIQLSESGMSYDNLREMNRAFILSKIKMEFSEPLRAHTPLSAVTFPCDSRGYSFLRCHSLEADGITVARAVSVWALVDTETRGLVKVDSFPLGLMTYQPFELEINRFSMPKELEEVGFFNVVYSDTDQNLHMNNTRYPDMYSNFLDLSGKRIRTISINYLKEAPAGERLSVYSARGENGAYYFRTIRKDGAVNSEAEIFLEELP